MANARIGDTALCPWRHAPRVNAHDHLVVGRVHVLAGERSNDVNDRWPLSFSDVALVVDARIVAATQTDADGAFMLLVVKKTKSSVAHKRQRMQQVEIRIFNALCGQFNVTRPSSMQLANEDEATIWEQDILIDPQEVVASCKYTELDASTRQVLLHGEQPRVPAVRGLGVCIHLLRSLVDSPNAFPFDEASRGFRLVLVSMIFVALFSFVTWRRQRSAAETQRVGDRQGECEPVQPTSKQTQQTQQTTAINSPQDGHHLSQ